MKGNEDIFVSLCTASQMLVLVALRTTATNTTVRIMLGVHWELLFSVAGGGRSLDSAK